MMDFRISELLQGEQAFIDDYQLELMRELMRDSENPERF